MDQAQLEQQLANIAASIKSVNERIANAPSADDFASLKAQQEELMQKYDSLREQLEQLQLEGTRPASGDDESAAEMKAHQKAFEAWFKGDFSRKDLVLDDEGRVLVPEDVDRQLVEHIAASAPTFRYLPMVGVTSDRVRKADLQIDVVVNRGNKETGSAMNASTFSVDDQVIELQDYDAKALVGRNVNRMSFADIQAFIRERFGEAFSLALEEDIWLGTAGSGGAGVLTEPIVGNPAITQVVTTANVGEVTVDDLFDLVAALPANAKLDRERTAIFMHSSTLATLLKEKAYGTGNYLLQTEADIRNGVPARFQGYPIVLVDRIPQVAAGNQVAVFGRLDKAYKAVYNETPTALERIVDSALRDQGKTAFYAWRRFGGGLVAPEWLAVLEVAAA